MSIILDTQNLAEDADFDDDESPREDMAATTTSAPDAKIEFHVQMRSWTVRDMEDLIVQAAANQMIRGLGDKQFAKLIEDRAISAITEKADAKIADVTAEIIDQPLTPAFGDKKPVTMREFIGLYAKEYLTEKVDRDGKPSKGGWGSTTFTRAELAVMNVMDRQFKSEIEKATRAAISEIQRDVKKAHDAVIAEESARIRAAISKATE